MIYAHDRSTGGMEGHLSELGMVKTCLGHTFGYLMRKREPKRKKKGKKE